MPIDPTGGPKAVPLLAPSVHSTISMHSLTQDFSDHTSIYKADKLKMQAVCDLINCELYTQHRGTV